MQKYCKHADEEQHECMAQEAERTKLVAVECK